jgi:hypothetical protein
MSEVVVRVKLTLRYQRPKRIFAGNHDKLKVWLLNLMEVFLVHLKNLKKTL